MGVQPRLASAIMLLRDAATGQGVEVFMVRRVIQSDFMPDVYVFPGGSVVSDDIVTEQTEGICNKVETSATDLEGHTVLGSGVRAAAIREMFEEAGVLLVEQNESMLAVTDLNIERFAVYRQAFNGRRGSLVEMAQAEHLVLATDRLHYFAHWITPEGLPKRFDTHFFVAEAPEKQQAAYDQLETSEGIWIAPAEALARTERREYPLVFATVYQLRELAAFSSVAEARSVISTTPVKVSIPRLIERDGIKHVYLAEDAENSWPLP